MGNSANEATKILFGYQGAICADSLSIGMTLGKEFSGEGVETIPPAELPTYQYKYTA